MKLFIKLVLLVVVVPALVVVSLLSLEKNGFFNLSNIEIELIAQADQLQFSKPLVEKMQMQLEQYKGQSLFRISIQKISKSFKEADWVKEFRISRSWPNKLVIEVEPYELVYLLAEEKKLAQGLIRPVTLDGAVLDEVKVDQVPALAIVKSNRLVNDKVKRKKIVELIKALPAEGSLSHKLISEVGYNQNDGYWVEVAKSAVRVKLGEDQFAVKSARASQVLDYINQRDLKARVIDANLSKKVLVRLQQTP